VVLHDKCFKAVHVSIKCTKPVHIHEEAIETAYKEEQRRL
jgi:hypothetical protein